ncbi:uncharacterized protein G6M90_00g059300 [Metarhizium brunneum]|uniref:Ribosomal protein n=1 Tax=Metarhizium brunneum TaxID=500148 RepID=A0A7D5YUY2_9HYPO
MGASVRGKFGQDRWWKGVAASTTDEGDEGSQLGEEALRALQGQNSRVARLVFLRDGIETKILTGYNTQVVRRKAGKRHNGYLYIICKANPRHKQRQS